MVLALATYTKHFHCLANNVYSLNVAGAILTGVIIYSKETKYETLDDKTEAHDSSGGEDESETVSRQIARVSISHQM